VCVCVCARACVLAHAHAHAHVSMWRMSFISLAASFSCCWCELFILIEVIGFVIQITVTDKELIT
jgi:hypothetical protein